MWKWDTANRRYRTLPYSYVFLFTYRACYSADNLIVHAGMHFRYGGDSTVISPIENLSVTSKVILLNKNYKGLGTVTEKENKQEETQTDDNIVP